MDLLIKANGEWIHQGEKINRPALVKLFSRILWLENNEYFLVTPVEKVRIQVEDAPFLITGFRFIEQDDGHPFVAFYTNTDDCLILGQNDHNLWLENSKPYVSVRYGMKALVHRNIYYELVELGIEKEINDIPHLCLQSGEAFFSLGALTDDN
ncbi:DUF1285 domain-containing protein [Marinomonas agarivorans]|nr:DUF1285 domain-containing protein [Marinomonas agarivorans]